MLGDMKNTKWTVTCTTETPETEKGLSWYGTADVGFSIVMKQITQLMKMIKTEPFFCNRVHEICQDLYGMRGK